MVAAAAGTLVVDWKRKSTADGAALLAVAAPQRMRPRRKPQGEQAGVKTS